MVTSPPPPGGPPTGAAPSDFDSPPTKKLPWLVITRGFFKSSRRFGVSVLVCACAPIPMVAESNNTNVQVRNFIMFLRCLVSGRSLSQKLEREIKGQTLNYWRRDRGLAASN